MGKDLKGLQCTDLLQNPATCTCTTEQEFDMMATSLGIGSNLTADQRQEPAPQTPFLTSNRVCIDNPVFDGL